MDNKLKIEVDGTPLTLEVTTRYRKPASQVNLDKVRHRFEEYEMLVKDKEQMAMTIEALDQNVLGLEEQVKELSKLLETSQGGYSSIIDINRRTQAINAQYSEQVKDLNKLNNDLIKKYTDAEENLKKFKKSDNFWFGATIVFIIVSVVLALSL